MFGGVTRRLVVGGALAVAARAAFAGAPATSLRPPPRPDALGGAAPGRAVLAAPSAEALIAQARLGGQVSFAVADARTGVVLESHAADHALPPASVTKTVTALYALSTLGAGYRFTTRFVATGPLRDGIVEGDLVLAGGGDPMLDTDALAAMVADLNAAGVRGVRGQFAVYAGALPEVRNIDPTQPDDVGYNPALGGLNLNFNRVHFEWKREGDGWALSLDARSKTRRPPVSTASVKVVERTSPVYTYASSRNRDVWTVANAALGKGGSRWLPVRRPDLYAGEVARALAAAQGIRLPEARAVSTMPEGHVLVRHDSASLATIVRLMLKYSTNLTAEIIGLTATARRGVRARDLAQSAQEMNRWLHRRYGARNARFANHSGLGGGSRIAAGDMVRLLVQTGPGSMLHDLMKKIPPRDEMGGLDAQAGYQIRAKTGTLNFVSALAGYVTTDDGKSLAFAIFAGDPARRARIPRAEMERPKGGRAWTRRARRLEYQLVRRWAELYAR